MQCEISGCILFIKKLLLGFFNNNASLEVIHFCFNFIIKF